MSPLDDELRAALHGRARSLAPSPDPLAGIERRAGAIRRRRTAASVAGSALAVAAIALAVPALTPPAGGPAPQVATSTAPSPAPTAVLPAPSAVLDPDDPWPYRGVPLAQLGEGTVATVTREYATARGVDEAAVRLTPLFGQVHEPSQSVELVFVATVDDEHRWGVAVSSEAGPEFLVDEALPAPALALAAALPGDEVARLLVVTAPGAGAVEYFVDEVVEDATPLTALADGVATGPLEGDPETDSLLVREPDGRERWRGPAPDLAPAAPGEPPVPGDDVPAPTNAVDWPLRGAVPDDVAERALVAFADAAGVSRDEVGSRLLFGAERDGRHHVLLQGWYGGDAQAFAWSGDAAETATSVLLPPTAPGPAVIAAVLDGVLLVVPEPAAGQVLYSPDGTSEPEPVPDQGTEAAVLIDRPAGTRSDRLLVLDGDGDLDRPLYRGTVEELLAASSS